MTSQDSQYAGSTLPDAALVGTARIGAELRQVRERAGWRLDEVAAELRIRLPYLEAIERGELKALPGPAYEVGFIRTYAHALGLDGDEILRRFRAEGAGSTPKPELSFLAPVPDRAVPTGAIVLVGVVILLAGYGLWFLHTEKERKLAAAVPAVPAQLAPLAIPPLAPAQVVKPPAPKPSAPAAAQTPEASAAAKAAAPPVSAGKTIQATADSWVQVKDASGNILFSRLMHAGDSWPVPELPGLTMTAGNAGGTDIVDDGAAGSPLGAAGTVVHNFALTAAAASATPPMPGPVTAGPGGPHSTSNASPAKAAN